MNKIYDFLMQYNNKDNILQFQPICLEDIITIGTVTSDDFDVAYFDIYSKYSSFCIIYKNIEYIEKSKYFSKIFKDLSIEREKLVLAWKEYKKC
jgi:hypothetical protein